MHGYDPFDLPVRQTEDEPQRFVTKKDVLVATLVAVALFVALVLVAG